MQRDRNRGTVTMSGRDEEQESKRGRVRRILIDPLKARGMRFPHRTDPDWAKKRLAAICDELAYASDRTLQAIREWAEGHGQGSDRTFWPTLEAFRSIAENFEPCPVEHHPALLSWFSSRAGTEALSEDRLVAEFCFVEKYKRPPLNDLERKKIADRAGEYRHEVTLIEDRLRRDVEPGPHARHFLSWYRDVEKRACALVAAGEAKRIAKGAAA